ncbi:MAG: hypothetical protein HY533_04315 [Chloroflexi bacterium]|nr:hypothetical protein [Chloroflexota bacterium]
MAMEEIISMADMRAIFSVTDDFGIDREHIRVELEKADPGSARLGSNGMLEIVAPLTGLEAWLPVLRQELLRLGLKEEREA